MGLPLYVLLMPLAFMLGDRMARLIKPPRPRATYVRLANWVLWPFYAVLLAVLIFLSSDMMFSGYVGGYDPAIMGPIRVYVDVAQTAGAAAARRSSPVPARSAGAQAQR